MRSHRGAVADRRPSRMTAISSVQSVSTVDGYQASGRHAAAGR
ncbi:hypothetical protein ACIA5D_49435 [Actinoplanes sp. NPDC051513]